nr:hypothetical protein [Sulfurovaceae bacterium]
LATELVKTDNLKSVGGDFSPKDSYELMNKSLIKKDILNTYKRFCKDRITLIFAINIQHCEDLKQEFLSDGIVAETYHSKKKDEDIIQRFKDRKIEVLISVSKLNVGFDHPPVNCVILARPTKSIPMMHQSIGRSSRFNPNSPKDDNLIIDLCEVIKNTIDPRSRLDFNREKKKKDKLCECGGKMLVIDKTLILLDEELQFYRETTTWECQECKNIDIVDSEKVVEMNFCIECDIEIETGTSETFIKNTDNSIDVISVCPHCKNEKIVRSVEQVEAKMIELKFNNIDSWQGIKDELSLAKNAEGKKYHHLWKDRVVMELQKENFEIKEVKTFIKYYKNKGWAIGGIVNAMIKKRNRQVNI